MRFRSRDAVGGRHVAIWARLVAVGVLESVAGAELRLAVPELIEPALDGVNGQAFGIAVAGRVAVTDNTGVATRVEYVVADEDLAGGTEDSELFSLTGTVDHALTDNVMVRGEVRWDSLIESSSSFTTGEDDQVVGLAEILFAF